MSRNSNHITNIIQHRLADRIYVLEQESIIIKKAFKEFYNQFQASQQSTSTEKKTEDAVDIDQIFRKVRTETEKQIRDMRNDIKSDMRKEFVLLEANVVEKAEQTAARIVRANNLAASVQQKQPDVTTKVSPVPTQAPKRRPKKQQQQPEDQPAVLLESIAAQISNAPSKITLNLDVSDENATAHTQKSSDILA